MIKRLKKVAVFYRDMPAALDYFIQTDGKMRLLKDGVFSTNGVRCPRATISMEWTGSETEKERLEALTRLLEELEANNQIVAFNIR